MSAADPFGAFSFRVIIDGLEVAGFSEVSGLESRTDVLEYRDGGEVAAAPHLLPGLTRYGPLVLKRGLACRDGLWEWRQSIIDGALDRRDVSIVLLDGKHEPVCSWKLRRAWPSKWEGPTLVGCESHVAIEAYVLEYEGIS